MKRLLVVALAVMCCSPAFAESDKEFCSQGAGVMVAHAAEAKAFLAKVRTNAGPVANGGAEAAVADLGRYLVDPELKAFASYARAAEALIPALENYVADAQVAGVVLKACADAP